MYYNQLNGTIPSTISTMSSLQILWMQNNQLSGPIPSTIGSLSSLTTLILSTNSALNSTLPDSITQLSSLV